MKINDYDLVAEVEVHHEEQDGLHSHLAVEAVDDALHLLKKC